MDNFSRRLQREAGSSWFHPPASRQTGQLVPKIGTEAARLTSAALQARSEGRKAPPLGASPRRLAAFGRPGSLCDPPTRHPHDEPASPARFLLVWGSFKRCAPIATTAPAAPSQLAFQKSHADRAAINPRGQGGRKRRHRCDFRAAGLHFRCLARLGGPGRLGALRASQAPISGKLDPRTVGQPKPHCSPSLLFCKPDMERHGQIEAGPRRRNGKTGQQPGRGAKAYAIVQKAAGGPSAGT